MSQGSSAKGLNAIDRDRPQSGRGVFWRFFDWIDKSSFEVAADAFTTFRVSAPPKPARFDGRERRLIDSVHRNS